MPNIPRSSAISIPRVSLPGPDVGRELQAGFERLGSQVSDILEGYQEDQRRNEFASLSGEMDQRLLDLQDEIDRDPTIKSAADAGQAYSERAHGIVEETTGKARWKAVSTALGARGVEAVVRGTIAVGRVGYEKEADASRAGLMQSLDTYSRSYSMGESPGEQQDALKNAHVALESNPYITEKDRFALGKIFDKNRIKQRVIRLAERGRFEEARKVLKSEDAASSLEPTDIYGLETTLSIAESRARTTRNRIEKDADRAKVRYVLERLYDDPDPEHPITPSDILDLGLRSRTATEHFIDIAKKKANGEDINYLDHEKVNRLTDMALRGEITDWTQIAPDVGHGVPIEEAKKIEAIMASNQKAEDKALNTQIKKFLDGYKSVITGSSYFPDPLGDQQFYLFRTEVERRVKAAAEAGEDPYALLLPGTPKYLGPLADQFRRTPAETLETQLDWVRGLTGKPGKAESKPKSFEDWVKEQQK